MTFSQSRKNTQSPVKALDGQVYVRIRYKILTGQMANPCWVTNSQWQTGGVWVRGKSFPIDGNGWSIVWPRKSKWKNGNRSLEKFFGRIILSDQCWSYTNKVRNICIYICASLYIYMSDSESYVRGAEKFLAQSTSQVINQAYFDVLQSHMQ